MPKLVATSGSVVVAEAGAHHYRFTGIEMAPAAGSHLINVIDLGSGMTTESDVPHDLTIDRCYVHGDPATGSRRGLALNAAHAIVSDSYFADFKEVGTDSQAIAGWNGPGPFQITNNYLEGAGENVLFGGADPTIDGLVPSDIVVERNHFAKPLAWLQGDPQYAGTPWTVKNLFELKNARRVVVNGNVFEFNWPQSQNGFAILFTVRNQDGHSPWSTVEDVTFSNNIVRHVSAGINILGHDDIYRSEPAQRLQIKNNLFADVGFRWTFGRLFQLLNGAADVVIQHNTAVHSETPLFGGDTLPHSGFHFEDNIVENNQYGIIGSGTGTGNSSLGRYFPGAVVLRNVIAGGAADVYPSDNFFPRVIEDVHFVDAVHDNYQLGASSPFLHKATDGSDPGVDMNALMAAQATHAVAPLPAVTQASVAPVFWAAVALVLYVYAGYGALLWLWARLRPRPVRRAPIQPLVSVIVIAFNEAARIAARLENLRAQSYPADRLQIIVASDGSTDGTEVLASAAERVQVAAFAARRGKASVLNDVLPAARGEIVVLADARQRFNPEAITELVACFADPDVGAVSGRLTLVPEGSSGAAGAGAAMYWNLETRIRWWESLIDSSVGATGAIYAIRRELFEPLAPDTLLDDVVIPMRIARAGRRVVLALGALAVDEVAVTSRQEYARKVRTIAGTFQLFARERWLLNPARNRLWLQTVSHKGLRLILPGLYATLLVTNVMLAASPFYLGLLTGQAVFYGAAIAGCPWPMRRRRVPVLVVPYTICLLSWATVVGFLRYVTHGQRVTWDRYPPVRSAR
jgi:cellulose synthase/poly-beta-1,6-N-acetylglucosamine synthase-like glycosyltransferase